MIFIGVVLSILLVPIVAIGLLLWLDSGHDDDYFDCL